MLNTMMPLKSTWKLTHKSYSNMLNTMIPQRPSWKLTLISSMLNTMMPPNEAGLKNIEHCWMLGSMGEFLNVCSTPHSKSHSNSDVSEIDLRALIVSVDPSTVVTWYSHGCSLWYQHLWPVDFCELVAGGRIMVGDFSPKKNERNH